MQSNHLLKTQKSFSDIYSIYYVRMLRFSQTYVIAEEDAENIVQDTFLYLWEHLELLEDIDHLDAFLFTLIKNRCLNFLKHQSYIQAKTCSLKADEELESQLNLYALEQFDEAVSSISEVENLLSRTMQKLPERCRISSFTGFYHLILFFVFPLVVNAFSIVFTIKPLKEP